MTQSSDKPQKRSLPVPPLIPPTQSQTATRVEDKTKIERHKFPSLEDSEVSSTSANDEFDLFNFDDDDLDFDDDDDDIEGDKENLTSVTSMDGLIPSLDKSNLEVPPPVSRSQSPLDKATSPSLHKQRNLNPRRNLTPPPVPSSNTGSREETNVRRGSALDKSTLRPGPKASSRPRTSVVGRSPGQPSLKELVELAHEKGYSDVHLGVGELPRMRDRGEILTLTQYPEIDRPTFMSWLREIMREEDIQKFQKELEFDGATQYDFARVRINVFDTLRGPALVLRLIPVNILSLEQLRLPPVFRDICETHKGLILITGPTGSGKSTTLAAMIDHINNEQARHIITIEDPVEFVHRSRKSLIKQREVGMHTLEFDRALKASLREDPDIILVGEMRDKATVNTALKAAQTGHLVMGTLHTNSAIKTLERIFTLYQPEEQTAIRSAIAESLVSIIAQGLCRTTDGKRAAYHDILVNTETVKDYIMSNKYEEIGQLMIDGEFDGMVTMNQSLFNLYEEGRITEETALENSPTRNEMAMMLRGNY